MKQRASPARRPCAGFTLVELLITLALAAILMGLAAPAFQGWMLNRRIQSTAESLLYALMQAREEAVRRNASVSVTIAPRTGGGIQWTRQAAAGLITAALPAEAPEVVPQGRADATPIVYAASNTAGAAGTFTANLPEVKVTFNGLGNLGTDTTVRRLDFRPQSGDPGRPLAIVLTMAGALRLCNPALARAQSVQGC